MNHSNPKLHIRQHQLRAQDIASAELNDAAVPLEFTRLRFDCINEADVNSPIRDPVTESEETAPLAVWIPLEQERLQFLPVGCRDPKQTRFGVSCGLHGCDSVVGTVNPAQDFVEVSMKPVLVFVPRRRPAAIVRMITHQMPASLGCGDNTLR